MSFLERMKVEAAVVVAALSFLFYDFSSTRPERSTVVQFRPEVVDIKANPVVAFVGPNRELHVRIFKPSPQIGPLPVVLTAHGYGCQSDFRPMPQNGEFFSSNGFAVINFDYRGFGLSSGAHLNELAVARQLEDWETMIRLALSNELPGVQIDTKNIFLWGTSYSGGHVLQIAGTSPNKDRLAGLVSQVPMVDGFRTGLNLASLSPLHWGPAIVAAALKDKLLSLFGKRHYWPIVGDKGEGLAIIGALKERTHYHTIVPNGDRIGGWINAAPAWAGLEFLWYRPTIHVSKITVPVLVIYNEDDELLPPQDTKACIAKMMNPEVRVAPSGGHYDIYHGEQLVFSQKTSLDFFQRHFRK